MVFTTVHGGIMYLYRNIYALFKTTLFIFLICIACTISYYLLPSKINGFEITFYKNFILYCIWLFYAIGVDSKILGNKIMTFFSGISLEIYLSHICFMEKLHVQYLFGEDNCLSYIVLCLFTLAGLMALIFSYKFIVRILNKYFLCKFTLKQGNK